MNRRAFTLIELLVGMAIFGIMLFFLFQVVSLASGTWTTAKDRTDNLTQARTVLGMMDRDVRSMVLRRDLASFVDADGNPAFAFYTRLPAPGGNRKLSLVRYLVVNSGGVPELQRSDLGFSYNSSSNSPTYGTTDTLPDLSRATPETLAHGVLRLELQFSSADRPLSDTFQFDYRDPLAPSNTRSVVVSLLVFDTSAMNIARDTATISSLLARFQGAPSPGKTYASHWTRILSEGTELAGLPAPVRRGLKVFERHIQLPLATGL